MKSKIKFACKRPGPKSLSIIRRDLKVVSQNLTREYDFVFKKAKGCYIWDVDGRRYLDFSAAVAVMNIGHSNPIIEKALHQQIKYATHVGFSDFYAELPVKFSEYLVKFLSPNLNQVFLSNSGTESIESAYKLARWHTNKKWAIAFNPSFHGRTMGSLSLTFSKAIHRDRYAPFLPVKHALYPYCYRCPFKKGEHSSSECANNYLDVLKKKIKESKKNVSAIFLESVAGEPGYIVPPKEFVKGLREICTKNNILLVADEVQSGCYRTGKFLAIENFGVKPDIVCLSKSIGGGVPLGATVSNKKIMDWPSGSHANTFGGNLLACAAGMATLKFMKEKKLGENAKKVGNFMLKRLNEMKQEYEIIGDVRGIGLMIGLEFVKDKKTKKLAHKERNGILCKASEKGLIMLGAGTDKNSVIRICPPLTLTKNQADLGLNILEDSIKEVSRS